MLHWTTKHEFDSFADANKSRELYLSNGYVCPTGKYEVGQKVVKVRKDTKGSFHVVTAVVEKVKKTEEEKAKPATEPVADGPAARHAAFLPKDQQ